MTDDPFGRKDDERTDAFGRPIEESSSESSQSGSLWSGQADRAAEPSERPRFAPPVDRPAAEQPSFAPPVEAPAERAAWWTEEREAVAGGELADYMQRVGAAVIDFFVRTAIVAAITIPLALAASDSGDAVAAGLLLGYYIVAPFYAPIAMSRWPGQTLGHRATGTRIVTRKGAPVTGGKAFVREYLTKYMLVEVVGGLMSLGIFGLVNYLWPLWDDRNEALHDKMCDTRVVKA